MLSYAKRIAGAATLLFLSLFLATKAETPARAGELAEYQIKAAYLYNFAKFVEWPGSAFSAADAPMTICVIGDDPFGGALNALQTKTIKNRKVAIRLLSGTNETGGCHVLFISPTETDRMDEILVSLKGRPTLVVGDTERFARRGGMIGFIMERNKVVFEVNEKTSKQAGLQVSSQLLKLARTVY
jgi:hypothetical protein